MIDPAAMQPRRTARYSLHPKDKNTDKVVSAGQSRRAHLRIFMIHEELRRETYPNCSSLAEMLERDRKTIQRDINYMRDEMNLPIEYDKIRHGYYYSEKVEEFPLLNLSKQDLLALFLARKVMEPLRGTRLEQELRESFSKIAQACPGEVSFDWQELDEAFSMRATGVAEADVSLFGDLLDAVRGRREVTFDYRKLTSKQLEPRLLRPYHLRQIEHAWYVVGYDVDRDAMRTFALQRMVKLVVTKRKFKREVEFDADEYFGGSFGVWNYDNESKRGRYEVRIRFEGYAARVVAERSWHATQEIVPLDDDGSAIEFRARLAGLEEVTRWILSWGSKARVIQPERLRQMVTDEVSKMQKQLHEDH